MKIQVARWMLFGLFSLAAAGTASALPLKPAEVAAPAVQPALPAASNPWSSVANAAAVQPAPLLAHDDHRWHDHRGTGAASSGAASRPGATGSGDVTGNAAGIGSAAMSGRCTNATMTNTGTTAAEADTPAAGASVSLGWGRLHPFCFQLQTVSLADVPGLARREFGAGFLLVRLQQLLDLLTTVHGPHGL